MYEKTWANEYGKCHKTGEETGTKKGRNEKKENEKKSDYEKKGMKEKNREIKRLDSSDILVPEL